MARWKQNGPPKSQQCSELKITEIFSEINGCIVQKFNIQINLN